MVQPEDIQRKAERVYAEFLRVFVADAAGSFFPRLVPTERELGVDIAEAAQLVQALRDGSKEVVGYGYRVEWREVNSRTLGRNVFPDRITFDSVDDLLRFVGKQHEFLTFSRAVKQLKSEFPTLSAWVASNIRSVIGVADELDALLTVLRYFVQTPRPGCFARELPVSVDTKFVERNQRILRQWFDLVLPAHAIRADEDYFELRYGLRYVEQEVFIRFLDAVVQRELGFPVEALSLPLHTLGALAVRDTNVVVVENKVNALTMPSFPRTVVIGGLGNASILLRHVRWLEHSRLTYWGDVDVEGLEILSRLRKTFPHARSVMMDEDAIHQWRHLTGLGTGRRAEVPAHLTPSERAAFRTCVEHNLRLEQERVPQVDVLAIFKELGF
jgi:hypothetical protein